jgi:hypothetical protein
LRSIDTLEKSIVDLQHGKIRASDD